KAWNFASDSHTSNTWIRPSASMATWYSLPGGAPAPACSSRLIVSSYRFGVNEVGVKYIPSAMFIVPLNISRFLSQATLSATDRGLGQTLAEYSRNCKLGEYTSQRSGSDHSPITNSHFLAGMRISWQPCPHSFSSLPLATA